MSLFHIIKLCLKGNVFFYSCHYHLMSKKISLIFRCNLKTLWKKIVKIHFFNSWILFFWTLFTIDWYLRCKGYFKQIVDLLLPISPNFWLCITYFRGQKNNTWHFLALFWPPPLPEVTFLIFCDQTFLCLICLELSNA
jgi:hypothetical protein